MGRRNEGRRPWRTLVIVSGMAWAVLASACQSRIDRLVQDLQERERAKAQAPAPRRETFRVRDPETGLVLEERTGLVDARGRFVRDGEELTWYRDGSLRSRRVFAAGEPTGQWLEWWKNGILRFAHDHQPGKATAMTWWHPNGIVQAEGLAKSGLRVGSWIYRDGRGRVIREGRFEAGRWAEMGTVPGT